MGKSINAFVLVVAAGMVLPLGGQSPSAQRTGASTEAERWKLQPCTKEYTDTFVSTWRDGTVHMRELHTITSQDSQGRHFFETTQLANGDTHTIVDDPVAGTRTVWDTTSSQAKVLIYPTPVAGRKSCWKIPAEEASRNVPRGAAQLGLVAFGCQPAGMPQTPYRGRSVAVEPPSDDSTLAKVSYADCLRALNSVTIPGTISEKTEDLNADTFQDLETHGCRKTTIVPAGRIVREAWLAKVGNKKHSLTFPVRDIEESPDTGRQTSELTSLTFEEPDPATFMPSEGLHDQESGDA